MPRTNDYPLDNITNPGPNDVLCIQAKCNHPGNVKFRKLAERNKQRFKLAKRGTKNDVAMDLVRKWRAMDPPGRFLAKMEGGDSQQSQEKEQQEEDSNNAGDDDNGSSNETEMTTLYYDVGDEKACTKARLSLRPSKGGPKLIEPDNSKKSKWWKYFNLYDPEYHPDKKDDAMCKFCGGDIAVKDGSAGDLCNHLKKYHVKECSELSKQAEQQTVVAKKKKPDDSVEIIEKPKLVKPHVNKPWSKYGKYWTHFMRYDAKAHPAKKKYVRCNLCRKDVHFKGDGLAVGNHLMLWHKNEYRALNNESTDNPDYGAGSHIASSHATNNKAVEKTNNQTSKESQNKEWFASWEKARNTLNKVRKELKEESDEETKEDFKADIRRLRKRKAEFETLLGMDE